MNNQDETVKLIVDGLSLLIKQSLNRAAQEQHYPSGGVDSSDETIKINKDRAAKLRKIREDFENEITGICL